MSKPKILYIYTVFWDKNILSKFNRTKEQLAMMDPDDWDELMAADEAAGRAVPEIVRRHRCAGVLTWALLHQIEGEVLAELEAGGEHSPSMLNMIRSAPVLGYPNDNRPVSLSSATVLPIIFRQIEKAWNLVH